MRAIKSLCIAFSMYSKIPVPQFEWKEEDMKYVLCFLPFIGVVTGMFFVLWERAASVLHIGTVCFTMVAAAISLLVTGGIHVDGYMDTMDAIHSYQDREKKLEIMKDPHTGAFAVIMLILYYLLYLGILSEVDSKETAAMIAMGFVWSRVLGALSVIALRPSKPTGLLRIFADSACKRRVLPVLVTEGVLCLLAMGKVSIGVTAAVLVFTGLWFLYYRRRSYREFGGVSGDTAGWFITICEFVIAGIVVAGFKF